MKINSILAISICFCVSMVLGDIFVGDGKSDEMMWRFSPTGDVIWSAGMRSASNFTLDPSGELVLVSRQGTDELLSTIDAYNGTDYNDQLITGSDIVDAEWGPDFNSDGEDDLYVSGRSEIWVVDVDIVALDDVQFTILDTWVVADTSGSNGTGGRLCFAPNGNLLSSKGGNSSGNRINVWDPMTGNQIASYNADNCRGAMDMIIGPDVNSDAQEDIWVVDLYRGQVRGYDYVTGAYLGIIDTGVDFTQPNDIILLPDNTVMISTAKGTSLSTGGDGSSYASVIHYDPVADTATLFYESDGANFACLAYSPLELPVPVQIEPQPYDVIAIERGDGTRDGNAFFKLMTRFAPNGEIIWQPSNEYGNSAYYMVDSLDQESVYVCYSGTSGTRYLRQFSAEDGSAIEFVFNNNDYCKAADWGYDYNSDGTSDLYLCSRDTIYVLDGTTVDGQVATVLTSYEESNTVYDGDSGTATGAGGFPVFGPDINSDGIGDLFVTNGGVSSGNRINVWDPTNLSRIVSYPAEECRWAISIVFSQDVNRDGREDMWVTDYGRSQIRCYDYMTGEYLGIAPVNVELDSPYAMKEAPDGMLYVISREGSSLNAGGVGDPGTDIIKINPQTGSAELFFSISGYEASFCGLSILEPTEGVCNDPIPQDLNQDCRVDELDLEVMAAQWLNCTNPNPAECN
ncbi:MAG: hypothetical protein ACIAQZ_15750 [Sedimentisphaeraceae bacterium JB056]